jgi:hypothetical protein
MLDTASGSNQIHKFASNGTYIASWGVLGFGDGRFAGIAGIGTDSSGNSKRYQRI